MSTRALWNSIRGFGLMAFCLLSAGVGIGAAAARGSDTLLAELTAAAAPTAAVDDPEPYVSEKGKFRFRFPGEPQLSEKKNGAVLIHSAMHVDSNGTTYGVTYTDLKPVAGRAIEPDAVLEGGVNGLAKSGAWKISSKKAIKLGKYPGRDVTADVTIAGAPEPGFGRTRIYLVGTRLYQVILLGLKSKVSSADFEKYLESFELMPGAAEAAENAVAENPEPYVSEKGKFRFQFPGEPELSEQKSGPLVIYATMYATADGTTYGVTYTDFNPAPGRKIDPDQVLDGGVNGLATAGGWKILSKNPIKLGEYPGRDVTGDVTVPNAPETGLGRTRIFLVGNRLYQVILIGPKSKVSADDFQNYLESFAILRETPAVAKAKPARPAPAAAAATAKARRTRQPMVKRGSPPGKAVATRTAPRNAKPAADSAPDIDDDPGPDPIKPAEIAINVDLASARLVELPSDGDRRRPRGDKFRETAPKGGLLVGVRVGYTKASKVGSIQPIFQTGDSYVEGERKGASIAGETTIVARPGYAVGAVNTRAGLLLDAFQIVFMKFENGKLDAGDSYASAWLGDPKGGNLKNVSGNGKIVAGFHGVTNEREVNSLGLVVAD